MSGLRRTPLYRALHRQNLLLGGEREPVLASAIACAGLPAASSNLVALDRGRRPLALSDRRPSHDGEGRSHDEPSLSAPAQPPRLLPGPLAAVTRSIEEPSC